MENFIVNNPTKIYFGHLKIETLIKELKHYGHNILVIYGQGSILNNGIYQTYVDPLKVSFNIIEFFGIKANPLSKDVDAAIVANIEKKIDCILAIGGGSVIDSAKIIAIGLETKQTSMNILKNKTLILSAKPLITILTVAGTGTEMNSYAVLQNEFEKSGFGHPCIYPKTSFLNPELLYTVNEKQTIYGLVDAIAHALEAYFGLGNAPLTDQFIFSIVKEAMELARISKTYLTNYTFRARTMWVSTCALNGLTSYGKGYGDWGVHSLGHTLSLLYDIPHGASLSIGYLAWFKHFEEKIRPQLSALGIALFGVNSINEIILEFESFFSSIGCPTRISEFIPKAKKLEIEKSMQLNNVGGHFYTYKDNEYKEIIDLMW